MLKKISLQSLQPIDKISIALMLVFSLVIGALIWGVRTTVPTIRNFTWQDKVIGAEDVAFIINFTRPMEKDSVEKNLQIEPPLPGKFSWAGRKMAYTLETPAPYGSKYSISLRGAREQFQGKDYKGKAIKPFESQFRTRDRAFAYIGVGEEEGQLIFQNLTKEQKAVLTPYTLVVTNFQPYPQGDKILFSATTRKDLKDGLQTDKIYTVTTGISIQDKGSEPAGKIELVLDSKEYQNLKFDLAKDGEKIIVQRLNRQDPMDFGLWLIKPNLPPQRLDQPPGGEFLIAPDSQTIAITQGEGIAITAIEAEAEGDELDFLPKYGRILDFSSDGSAAAMVNFNSNDPELRYSQSLFFVNNQGVQKELFSLPGSIRDCEFGANANRMYCILAQRIEEAEEYREQPYLAVVDLKIEEVVVVASLPDQLDIHLNLSGDGLGLLIDEISTTDDPNSKGLMISSAGQVIVDGTIKILVTTPSLSPSEADLELEDLPMKGYKPQWLP